MLYLYGTNVIMYSASCFGNVGSTICFLLFYHKIRLYFGKGCDIMSLVLMEQLRPQVKELLENILELRDSL